MANAYDAMDGMFRVATRLGMLEAYFPQMKPHVDVMLNDLAIGLSVLRGMSDGPSEPTNRDVGFNESNSDV